MTRKIELVLDLYVTLEIVDMPLRSKAVVCLDFFNKRKQQTFVEIRS